MNTGSFTNVVVFLIFLFETFQFANDGIKWLSIVLILIASMLSAIKTYLNFLPLIIGHERMTEKFRKQNKKYKMLLLGYEDKTVTSREFYERLEECYDKHSELLKDGHAFPTNDADYRKAQKIIEG